MAALWAGLPALASDATYVFRWQGGGGYSMEGALSFDPALMGQMIVETDVICFSVTGRKDGEVVGQWQLGQLGLDTSWRLHFDSAAEQFVVEGQGLRMPQAWNMNGAGVNCGEGGFGFNLGNQAQDICLDNQLITSSQMPPETPFPAQRDDSHSFAVGACIGPELLS